MADESTNDLSGKLILQGMSSMGAQISEIREAQVRASEHTHEMGLQLARIAATVEIIGGVSIRQTALERRFDDLNTRFSILESEVENGDFGHRITVVERNWIKVSGGLIVLSILLGIASHIWGHVL
jgi:hypothetical protein